MVEHDQYAGNDPLPWITQGVLDAEYKDKEEDVNAQSRRVLLLESECTIQIGRYLSIS